MRIAVTGATSDFGAVIIPRLLNDARVAQVIGVSRGRCGIRHAKYRHVAMDIRDRGLAEVFRGCETILHLAFVVEEIRDKKLTNAINIDGSVNVLESASRSGARHLVIASSINAYGNPVGVARPLDETTFPMGDPRCYYHYAKAQVEHYAEWWLRGNPAAMAITLLRPSYVVGQHFDNNGIDAMSAPIFAIPQARRAAFQYLHESDLADAFCRVIYRRLGGVFNIAPVDSTPVRRLARMHGQLLLSVPERIARPAADLLFFVGVTKFSGDWVTAGEPPVDSSLFRRRTGWKPTLTSDEAAALMLLYAGRPILDASFVPRRQVACETILRPTTDFLAECMGRRHETSTEPTHHHVPLPDGVLVHVERHRVHGDTRSPTIVLPAPGLHARFYTHLAPKLGGDGDVLIIDPPGAGLSSGRRAVAKPTTVVRAVESVRRAFAPHNHAGATDAVVVCASDPAEVHRLAGRPELLLVDGPVAAGNWLAALRRAGYRVVANSWGCLP